MWLFRKSLDLRRAAPRPVEAGDITRVSRLFRDGGRRYYALIGGDLPGLLAAGRGVALAADDDLLAVALTGWPNEARSWLRGVAIAEGVDPRQAMSLLFPALQRQGVEQSLQTIYYAGDEAADPWLVPALRDQGYQIDTEVIVYEKRDLSIPSRGNPHVRVRSATSVDLAEVIRLDHACFEAHWTKDDLVLAPAIDHGPLFLIAEQDDVAAGYAYATSHFGGRLIHLVRIAVSPPLQGQGIGVRLMAAVVEFAAAQRAETITLNTQAYNLHAQRLYRWFGFATTGERQIVLRYNLQTARPGEPGIDPHV